VAARTAAPGDTEVSFAGPLVELQAVTKVFGGLTAVRDVSLSVNRGEIVSVIGPNGSGKSTLFNLINGILPLTSGDIRMFGRTTRGLGAHRVARLGVGRTFQTTQVFADKTVVDNAMVGRHLRVKTGLWAAQVRGTRFRDEEQRHRERSLQTLEVVGLREHAARLAGQLPTALQQRVAIAMALAGEPELLLLDEPTGGLMEQEVMDLMGLLRRIRELGVTIMLIEHKMRLVRQVSDRIAVLNNGTMICEGVPDKVLNDELVVEAYLGTAGSSAAYWA
jgi:branched-chain amino acid transport system ATP-binding protein